MPHRSYLQGLFALAMDTEPSVRREVCIGLVQLLSVQPDRLQPFLYQVIEYMLVTNEHADQDVALQVMGGARKGAVGTAGEVWGKGGMWDCSSSGLRDGPQVWTVGW